MAARCRPTPITREVLNSLIERNSRDLGMSLAEQLEVLQLVKTHLDLVELLEKFKGQGAADAFAQLGRLRDFRRRIDLAIPVLDSAIEFAQAFAVSSEESPQPARRPPTKKGR